MVNYSMKEFGIDKIKSKYYGGKFFSGLGKLITLPFGGPLLIKGLDLGRKGIASAVRGVKWVGNTAKEGALGVKDMTLKPAYRMGTAAVDDIKRTRFWDVPIASLKAAYRTPIATILAPWNFLVKGVRASIASIPDNAKDVWNNFTSFKPIETIKSTRNLVWDVLKNPFTHTVGPIVKPVAEVGKEIGRAKWSHVLGVRQALEDVTGGWERFKNAPRVASEKMEIEKEFQRQITERKEEIKKEKWETELKEAGIDIKPEIGKDSKIIDLNERRKKMQEDREAYSRAA